MTWNEAKKLSKGALIRFKAQPTYSAKNGATARVVAQEPNGIILNIEWIRDRLDGGQHNGGYLAEHFELVSVKDPMPTPTAVKTQICNCSTFDFARYGCRYLQKVDLNGFLHL